MRALGTIAFLAVIGCRGQAPAPPDLDVETSACAGCHLQRTLEFGQSRMQHGAVTRSFRSFRALAALDRGEVYAATCTKRCHAADVPGVTPSAKGLTCEVCHLSTAIEAGAEGPRLVYGDARAVTGPPSVGNPRHEYAGRPDFAGAELCATCHARTHGASEAAPHSTFTSWQTGRPQLTLTCVECHMEDGSHAFVGAQRVWLREAVEASLDVDSGHPVLQIANNVAGHGVPSDATDLRSVEVWVTWLDRAAGALGRERVASFGVCHRDERGRAVPYWRSTTQTCSVLEYMKPHRLRLLPPPQATAMRVETVSHRISPELSWLFAEPEAFDPQTQVLRIETFALPGPGREYLGGRVP